MLDKKWLDYFRQELAKAQRELTDFKEAVAQHGLRVRYRDINSERNMTDENVRTLEDAVREYKSIVDKETGASMRHLKGETFWITPDGTETNHAIIRAVLQDGTFKFSFRYEGDDFKGVLSPRGTARNVYAGTWQAGTESGLITNCDFVVDDDTVSVAGTWDERGKLNRWCAELDAEPGTGDVPADVA